MTSEPYSEHVRQLFSDPGHTGDLAGGQQVRIDDQGVRIALAATCEAGVVTGLRFRAWGCPHVLAAAESFCRDYEGRPCADLLDFTAAELMQTLPVPKEKLGRILVLEDAVRSLGQSVRHNPTDKAE